MKFGMQAVLSAHPGQGQALADTMLQASALVAAKPGCEIYVVQVALNDSDKILITEVWLSQQDHQASLADTKIRELITAAKPLIVGMEHHPAKPLGGKGV
jgi:quinol monooxygenase YgiN